MFRATAAPLKSSVVPSRALWPQARPKGLGAPICISNCGTKIVNNDKPPASFIKIGYFEGYGTSRAYQRVDVRTIDLSINILIFTLPLPPSRPARSMSTWAHPWRSSSTLRVFRRLDLLHRPFDLWHFSRRRQWRQSQPYCPQHCQVYLANDLDGVAMVGHRRAHPVAAILWTC
jgi:hypothetical protein